MKDFSNVAVDPENVALFKEVIEEIEFALTHGRLSAREAEEARQQADRELFNISTDGLSNLLGRLCFRNRGL
jgi:hypothetical protein